MFKAEDISKGCHLKIYLGAKGELTLTQICDLITAGDTDCIDSLLSTIEETMAAQNSNVHVPAVRRLYYKCIILGGLLFVRDFDRKVEVSKIFSKLSQYSEEINFQLH